MPEVIQENSFEEVKSVIEEIVKVNSQLDLTIAENDRAFQSDNEDQNRLVTSTTGHIIAADDQAINIEVLKSQLGELGIG